MLVIDLRQAVDPDEHKKSDVVTNASVSPLTLLGSPPTGQLLSADQHNETKGGVQDVD